MRKTGAQWCEYCLVSSIAREAVLSGTAGASIEIRLNDALIWLLWRDQLYSSLKNSTKFINLKKRCIFMILNEFNSITLTRTLSLYYVLLPGGIFVGDTWRDPLQQIYLVTFNRSDEESSFCQTIFRPTETVRRGKQFLSNDPSSDRNCQARDRLTETCHKRSLTTDAGRKFKVVKKRNST